MPDIELALLKLNYPVAVVQPFLSMMSFSYLHQGLIMSMNDPARADYVNLCVNLPVTAHCPEPIVLAPGVSLFTYNLVGGVYR
ncbi:hypothetical protein GCM10027094_21810 [Hafnia psychrotolerans]